MWKQVELHTTPAEYQQRISTYLKNRNGAQLLKVIACINNDELYKYTSYLSWGNTCTVISMWLDGGLYGMFNEGSMTVGEMKEFIEHPEMSFWFDKINN